MICDKCGFVISEELNVCPNCGKTLNNKQIDNNFVHENHAENGNMNETVKPLDSSHSVESAETIDNSVDGNIEVTAQKDDTGITAEDDTNANSSGVDNADENDDEPVVFNTYDSAKDTKKTRNNFITIAAIAVISVLIILGVVLAKNHIFESSPAKACERYIKATYSFDIDNYMQYSTLNNDCQQILGNIDYDFNEKYSAISDDFSDLKNYTVTSFESYEAVPDIGNEEIYYKGSAEYDEYLEKYDDIYTVSDSISAFAKIDAEITIKYTYNGSPDEESSDLTLYCKKVNDNWYVIE